MKIYIASPFFNDKQVAVVRKLEELLESRGYETYSPMRDGIKLTPDASKEDRAKVFHENVTNLSDCDLVIANIDDRDTGTMVEIGMKFGIWKMTVDTLTEIKRTDDSILTELDKVILNQKTPRIVTYSDDGWDINIMLLGAVIDHCKGVEELNKCLDYIDEVGLNYAERDEDKLSRNRCF